MIPERPPFDKGFVKWILSHTVLNKDESEGENLTFYIKYAIIVVRG